MNSATDVKKPAAQAEVETPRHGGDLQKFCSTYGFSEEETLDLSTGISPWSWPVPDIPQKVWQSLPYGNFDLNKKHPDLVEVAARYYQCDPENLLPVAGSQAVIEVLPRMATPKSIATPESKLLVPVNSAKVEVLVPSIGYAEHAFHWQRNGYLVSKYSHLKDLESELKQGDAKYAVVINPNNPGAEQYSSKELLPIAQELGKRGGFLIVDEAFADAKPEFSLAVYASQNPLIVLRSLGKFFGLAGLRLGFAIGSQSLVAQLKSETGLWSVNSAAHWLGERMLSDSDWVSAQILRLTDESSRLYEYLQKNLPELDWKKSANFVSGFGTDEATARLQLQFAQSAIMVRRFAGSSLHGIPSIIRIGLTDQAGMHWLESALKNLEQKNDI